MEKYLTTVIDLLWNNLTELRSRCGKYISSIQLVETSAINGYASPTGISYISFQILQSSNGNDNDPHTDDGWEMTKLGSQLIIINISSGVLYLGVC